MNDDDSISNFAEVDNKINNFLGQKVEETKLLLGKTGSFPYSQEVSVGFS